MAATPKHYRIEGNPYWIFVPAPEHRGHYLRVPRTVATHDCARCGSPAGVPCWGDARRYTATTCPIRRPGMLFRLQPCKDCGGVLHNGDAHYCYGCAAKRQVASNRRSARRYPDRNRARSITKHAIESGRLKRPDRCSRCHNPPRGRSRIHAHHDDYSRPLDVMWLCQTCHAARHRELRAQAKETA